MSPSGGPLAAGPFRAWLSALGEALDGRGDSDVACGECVACCSSRQFVHIAPDETDTLAHIPSALLFPAPQQPKGHLLMGYDELGRCPMLADHGCTIYEHRPRTCRTYDCRVFAAAGVFPDEPDKAAIAERARRWRFDLDGDASQATHLAVHSAAARLRREDPDMPATPLAVRACRAVIEGTTA